MVDGGKVVDARNEGTIFRGFELIMVGRDPRDAPYLTQRICGICSSAHGLTSCLALESIAGADQPPNAGIIRNLIFGLDLLQNHIRHFYALGLWDWVQPPPEHPFSGGYTRDFRLSPRATERLIENYWAGVEQARLAHEYLTLLAGKAPHNHGIVPGGVSVVPDRDMIGQLRHGIKNLSSFIEHTYLPDAQILDQEYPDYREIGLGEPNYLSFGMFHDPSGEGFPPGAVLQGKAEEVELSQVEESHAHTWVKGDGGHPGKGTTIPDPEREEAYSWIKAPRYRGFACQGGPRVREIIGRDQLPGRNSTMDRITARAREASKVAHLMLGWLDEIEPEGPGVVEIELPQSGSGVGAMEAMRGPLAHWVTVNDGRIARYQIITPSAWNFSPRDSEGRLGPVEEVLLDVPVQDLSQPVEIGRVIRSFDPCYACTAHVIDQSGGTATQFRLL